MRWVLEFVLVALLLAALLGGWRLMRRTARRAQAQQQAAEAATERRQRRIEALAQVTLALSQQLDPDRLLQQITLEDAARADDLFSVLMGEDVEARRSFIQRNAKDVRFLDV